MRRQTWINPNDIAIELLSRSNLIETTIRLVYKACHAVVVWVGTEASTHKNSAPPYFAPSRRGTWSGVVIVHRNRVTLWALLPSGNLLERRDASLEDIETFDEPSGPAEPWRHRP